jgi:hypothetical protein
LYYIHLIEPSLKLIALRNNETGDYLDYLELVNASSKYNIPLVKSWTPEEVGIDMSDRENFSIFEQKIKKTVCK